MGGKQIIIKNYDKTLFKATVSNEQAKEIMNLLDLKDDTLDTENRIDNHNAIATYYGGTNPND